MSTVFEIGFALGVLFRCTGSSLYGPVPAAEAVWRSFAADAPAVAVARSASDRPAGEVRPVLIWANGEVEALLFYTKRVNARLRRTILIPRDLKLVECNGKAELRVGPVNAANDGICVRFDDIADIDSLLEAIGRLREELSLQDRVEDDSDGSACVVGDLSGLRFRIL